VRDFAVTVTVETGHEVDLDGLLEALQDPPVGAAVSGDDDRVSAIMTLPGKDTVDAHRAGVTLLRSAIARVDPACEGEHTIVEVEVLTTEEQERVLGQPLHPELAGIMEVAELLGVTAARVEQLRERPGFPQPTVTLQTGPVWTKESLGHFTDGLSVRAPRPGKEDLELLTAYLDAQQHLDEVAGSGREDDLDAAELAWAQAVIAYCDGLTAIGHLPRLGLRDEAMSVLRGLRAREERGPGQSR
jgi:hypothetical protein